MVVERVVIFMDVYRNGVHLNYGYLTHRQDDYSKIDLSEAIKIIRKEKPTQRVAAAFSTKSFLDEILIHHGIPGQKWGVRNGPPYPLNDSTVSSSEKLASKKKTLDSNEKKQDNKATANDHVSLTSAQKKMITVGVAAAAVGLATYGAYRMGYLDGLSSKGKMVTGDLLGKLSDEPAFQLESSSGGIVHFKKLPKRESVDTVLSKVNPTGSHDNCYNVVVATVARLCGFDVSAKGDTQSGRGLSFDDVCRAFKLNPDDESQVRRIHNPTVERIVKQIEKCYTEGDVGAIGLSWKETPLLKGCGHTLNWIIKNGKAEFIDGQINKRGDFLKGFIKFNMSQQHEVSIARFANIDQGIDLTENIDIDLFKHMVNAG